MHLRPEEALLYTLSFKGGEGALRSRKRSNQKHKKRKDEDFFNPGPSNIVEFMADGREVARELKSHGNISLWVAASAVDMASIPFSLVWERRKREVRGLFSQHTPWTPRDLEIYKNMAKSPRLLRIEDTEGGPPCPGHYP